MAQGDIYSNAIQPLWDQIDIYSTPKTYLNACTHAQPELVQLFVADLCQSEVNNGGFEQFFFNSSGIVAVEVLAGFRAMSLQAWADSLEDAIRLFGPKYPRARWTRRLRMLNLPYVPRVDKSAFSKLDARFYGWGNANPADWCRIADEFASSIGAE